jgi:hypothetical protein
MSTTVEASALQEGILRLLAAEIQEWELEEVLAKTESLRLRLGLKTEQLQAAICGASEVIIIIAGGVADRDTVFAARERDQAAERDTATDDLAVSPARLNAEDFLHRGLSRMQDRASQEGAINGERLMERTVEAFNAVTGCDLTESEGWTLMQMFEIVRVNQSGPFNADGYADLTAFAALAGEAAAKRQRCIDEDSEAMA